MKFLFQRYIVCWGKIYGSKIIGGGARPEPPPPFYSVKLCIALRLEKSFKKFYGRYQDPIEKYERSVNVMVSDSFPG